MGKIKTTKKAILNAYAKRSILSVGYCNLQYLLQYEQPIYYTTGTYGWACDCYLIDGVLISTGYSPVDGGLKCDYEVSEKYETQAKKIRYDISDYEERKKNTKELLKKFIEEVKATC